MEIRHNPFPNLSEALLPSLPSLPLLPQAPAAPVEDRVTLDGEAVRQRDRELQVGVDVYQANPAWQSLPGGIRVQTNRPGASMAIIDGFGMDRDYRGQPVGPAHGETVAALAQRASGQGEDNLLRLDVGAVPSEWRANFNSINRENFGPDLDRLINRFYTGMANETTQALREIRENHPGVNTVNHSRGVNGPSILANLAQQSETFEPLRRDLARELGLPEDTRFNLSNPSALVALAGRVQGSLQSSPEVSEAQRNLQAELERGQGRYTYFNSAGNHGEYQAVLERNGFRFDPRFAGNAPSNSPATQTVGALGPFGIQPYSQHVPYSTLANDQTRFQMDGRELCGSVIPFLIPRQEACLQHSGTSYAAPSAAGDHNRRMAMRRLQEQALPPQP